ncbi:MAG: hypothetical protein KatS3mg057_2565 [Herpetosiphonaceae bacterium]|nr:MAG: hypothetical protein KatS3mg057_2565 [Herpetosiphonaceae bacterium]
MISESLARLERTPPALAIHILPAHQELIAPLPAGYVGPAMEAGEAWLRRFGYKALGPWLISWGASGRPELRRPVSGALRAMEEGAFQTREIPPLLMLAVPFQGWPVLPYNLMPTVQAQGFEPIGQPLLLALGNDPPTIAWVPVMPRGTLTLAQAITATGITRKIGLLPPPPQPGVLMTRADLLRNVWLSTWHTLVGLLISLLLVFNCTGLAYFTIFALLSNLAVLVIGGLIGFAVILLLKLITYGRALLKWNNFWRGRPMPPVLAIHGVGASDVEIPAWFSGGR